VLEERLPAVDHDFCGIAKAQSEIEPRSAGYRRAFAGWHKVH
jgi:hypothetical protein